MENKEGEDEKKDKKTKFIFMVSFNSVLDFRGLLFITYIFPI
jgi:hypothetical protein